MRIWSKQAFAKINQQNKTFIQKHLFGQIESDSEYRIGIVGGGPKGAYAIERLASIWQAHLPDEKLEIICFNTDEHFASGPNYLPEQPDYLLINYSLGNVSFWTEEPEQLVLERPSLCEFITNFQDKDRQIAHPEDFCSRALTGIYLQHCLCQVISSLPETICVQLVPAAATSLDFNDKALILSDEMRNVYSFSEVIFCTGHSYAFQDEISNLLRKETARKGRLTYVEQIYPIARLRKTDFACKNVLVKGMGLTFVDAILGLTEGMGGEFVSNENSLTYIPSGLEPARIYPFSRTGLPMLARQAGGAENLRLKYFTDNFVENLLLSGKKPAFEADLYPTIEKEYRYQFVKNLLNQYDGSIDLEDASISLEEVEYLAQSALPDFTAFDLQKFLLPTLGTHSHHNAVLDYITQSIAPAHFPPEVQSIQDMSAVWRAIYPNFRKLYNFGGLSGKSQELVDQRYFGYFQRVSYGPPIWNMRKIHALAVAGIIRFDIGPSPTLSINSDRQLFEIESEGMLMKIESEILINARIAKIGKISSHQSIYKQLHAKYGIQQYQNDNYKPGCFELDEEGALIGLKGVTLNGTPTEGWTLDNESLSRTNNNFITPWAKKLVNNYVKRISQINPYCPSVD